MTDGILKTNEDVLIFVPEIYPTTQIKGIGFRWDRDKKYYYAPLNMSSLQGVRRMFNDVQYDDSVAVWEERQYILDMPEEIEYDDKAMDFQKEPAAFMLKHKRCLLGLAPGLGKTFCSILAAKTMGSSRILVISPLSLVRNWKKEIYKWSGEKSIFWYGNWKNWDAPDKWVVTNYDTAIRNSEQLRMCNFDIAIIDESILVKNRKTTRSKVVKEIVKDVPYVWLLSGSPTSKFYDDLWSQLNILDPSRFYSYWKFVERYCVLERNQWGVKVSANQLDADVRLKEDLFDMYYARTQDQVLDLPPWIIDSMEIGMSKTQYRLYKEMEDTFLATLPEGDEILAPSVLTQMLRLIQFASNPLLVGSGYDSLKWDSVSEILEYETLPALIWTTFKATAHAMEDRLSKKYRVRALTGDTPEKERQHIVDAFQSGGLDIIIAHPGVGKYGFTLTAARTAIYLERGYSGDDYYQSLHRIRRIGTTLSPHVIHLLSARPDNGGATIDHVIDKVLKYRKDSSIMLTSGNIRRLFNDG